MGKKKYKVDDLEWLKKYADEEFHRKTSSNKIIKMIPLGIAGAVGMFAASGLKKNLLKKKNKKNKKK
jgi:hypothetical protein